MHATPQAYAGTSTSSTYATSPVQDTEHSVVEAMQGEGYEEEDDGMRELFEEDEEDDNMRDLFA